MVGSWFRYARIRSISGICEGRSGLLDLGTDLQSRVHLPMLVLNVVTVYLLRLYYEAPVARLVLINTGRIIPKTVP